MINFDEILKLDETGKKVVSPLIIYGTGKVAGIFYEYCRHNGWEILAICDSNPAKVGTVFKDRVVSDFDSSIKDIDNYSVAIATGPKAFDEIRSMLLNKIEASKLFFNECPFNNTQREEFVNLIHTQQERLNALYEKLSDEKSQEVMIQVLKGNVSENNQFFIDAFSLGQYFNELTDGSDEEYFVDAGAYIGDTLETFIEYKQGRFNKIYSFEPFKECFEGLVKTASKYPELRDKIELYNMGLFSRNGQVNFDSTLPGGSNKIDNSASSDNTFEITTLDELNLEKVTFIKMDIEGSEYDALLGATETIKKYKPKLAICVYHKVADILDLSEYIESLNLGYKFYLRHYKDFSINNLYYCETVLYAL